MQTFQKQDHPLYFLYGSNMAPPQLAARCASPERVSVARLVGHALAFFGHSTVWDGGEVTVIRRPGEEVWGVVYRLSAADADTLDAWQGVRDDGSGTYFLYPSQVVTPGGVSLSVRFYRRDFCGRPQPPSEGYLGHIVGAAAAQGLPADYVERLKRIEARKARYDVPRAETRGREGLFLRSCCGCG